MLVVQESSVNNPPEGESPQCQFFVMRKKRLCRMTVRPGRRYCGEHEPQPQLPSGQNDTRIPCPNDPKHTCYASKLQKHLSICNARAGEQPPYIVPGVNAPAPPAAASRPRRALSQVPAEELARLIEKVNRLYDEHIKDNISPLEEPAIHEVVAGEYNEADRADSSRRHLRQVSSLLRLAEAEGLVRPNTCYVELGAGKGHLSYYAWRAWCAGAARSRVLLVDRASLRHKRDNKLRDLAAAAAAAAQAEESAEAEAEASTRLRADLAHLALHQVAAVQDCDHVVGFAKHLCGVATDSYKDANEYIKLLDRIEIQNKTYVGIAEKVTPSTSNRKIPKSSLNSEMKELPPAELNNSPKSAADNTNTIKPQLADPIVKSRENQIADPPSNPKRHFTRNTAQLYLKTSVKSISSQENELSVNQVPELISKPKPLLIPRLMFDNEFIEVLTKLHSECSKKQVMFDNMRLAYHQQCLALEKALEFTSKFNNFYIKYFNITTTENLASAAREMKKVVMEVMNDKDNEKGVKKMKVQTEEEKNDSKIDKKNEDKKNNFLEKIRGEAREFTLPPEYDANNSKWTLKNHEKKKGLVELLPHSGVFIDVIGLSNCHRLSGNSKTLARMLLLEIFTKNALRTCSLTGRRANAFNLDGKNVRPGLDKHAKNVLLNYVEKYSVKKKWVKVSVQTILSSLRNKIQEIRDKHR